jgi:hypothetical protein
MAAIADPATRFAMSVITHSRTSCMRVPHQVDQDAYADVESAQETGRDERQQRSVRLLVAFGDQSLVGLLELGPAHARQVEPRLSHRPGGTEARHFDGGNQP